MPYEPKPGHYLHASCSDKTVYEIIGSGKDANGAPTIDVRVLDLNAVLHFEHDDDATGDGSDGKWFVPRTVAELPEGVHVVFRGMQWRPARPGYDDAERIEVNAPEGGCYRCCNLFSVHASPGGRDPVRAGAGG
ncbi:MAG: hypothetical protein KGI71_04930 [Patescibacteria group bacterium]|nr:hypothetical protein [Patescibacteria group bacterium]